MEVDGVDMISMGWSNPTPWETDRECSEDELGTRIERMTAELHDPARAMFNLHCPQFGSKLDEAPALDKELRPLQVDKKDFQGREALVRQRAEGLRRKLCCLILAGGTVRPLGNEPVFSKEGVVSRVTSGGYGFTVRESIAYAYLSMSLATPGTEVAVEVDGRHVPATVQREPRYDPTHSRIKA